MQPSEREQKLVKASGLLRARRFAEATALCDEVLAAFPGHEPALFLAAGAAHYSGNLPRAAELLRECIRQVPSSADYHLNLGDVLTRMQAFGQAIEHLQRAIALKPYFAEPHYHLAVAFQAMRRLPDAEAEYHRFLEMRPGVAQAHYNLGVLLQAQDRGAEAAEQYQLALKLKPDYVAAGSNLASVFLRMRRYELATSALEQVLRQKPDMPSAVATMGSLLGDCGRIDEGIPLCRKAAELDPNSPAIQSALILRLQRDPNSSMQDIQRELVRFDERFAKPLANESTSHTNDRDPDRPLRIGFVSGELNDHVVAWNTMPLFRNLNRDRFQVAFYSNTYRSDHVTQQLKSIAATWRDIPHLTDAQLAAQVRDDRIDILVDMNLHTSSNRLLAFARRPAPVQMTFAGYPGSTGLSAIDYRISDPYLDPPGMFDAFCSERIARMPHSFWCYEPQPGDPDVSPLPAAGGPVTFACLNELRKLNRPVMELFSRVLLAVPGSRLLLLSNPGPHCDFLRSIFARHGVDASRVEFLPNTSRSNYMRYYHGADISLDPSPYNGHTTGLDSLWMGVPIVTLEGRTIVSRAGLCILRNLQMDELIAPDPEHYVPIASALAGDVSRLKAIRASLRSRMTSSPLCDAQAFAHGFEQICRDAWRRYCTIV